MIIKNVCLLLEMLSITMCLHQLYGEKYRLDIATVSLLAIDMVMMQAIDYLGMPSMASILIYPIIVIYCGMEFGFKIKQILVNGVLCVIIIGTIEMMGTLVVYYLFGIQDFSDYKLLFVNCVVFLITIKLLPILKMNKISKFLQDKERILIVTLLICLIAVFGIIIGYKKIDLMDLYNTFVLFVCIVFILILAVNLTKYKLKATEMETELKMHKLYAESFQGLIENIRLRQHEFDNHINAIYSQHYSNHTYEELVAAQRSYCELITKENRFNKLLSQGNSIIRGFLYGRFVEIEKLGIDISYHVVIKELDIGMPVYKLVEILGDLMNNAIEALVVDDERNKLYISIVETDRFYLEVRNESPYITYEMRNIFFKKGYSKKGEERGLGLYNVKQICEEYGFDISSDNKEIDGNNWIIFKIWKAD